MCAQLVEHRAHDLELDDRARVVGVAGEQRRERFELVARAAMLDGPADVPPQAPDVLTRQLELTAKRIEPTLVAVVNVREHTTQQPTLGERR